MPCKYEHYEPSSDVKAGWHLAYLRGEGVKLAEGVDNTARLCATIREMSPEYIDLYVYNARSAESRALADWWERHQREDAEREERERRERENKALRTAARAKLTDAEWDAMKGRQ